MLTFLLSQALEKGLIAVAILVVLLYIYIVTSSLFSLFKLKKTLRAAELSIKMSIVELITLVKKLCEVSNLNLTEDEEELLEEIETKIVNEEIFGLYSKVNQVYCSKLNLAKSLQNFNEISNLVETNNILQLEIDGLYQKALFTFNNDVAAYNYYLKSIIIKPFTLMFGFKKKNKM